MARARQRLADTGQPLNAVAEACGFESVSHFQALFKKAAGVTPGQYRRMARLPL